MDQGSVGGYLKKKKFYRSHLGNRIINILNLSQSFLKINILSNPLNKLFSFFFFFFTEIEFRDFSISMFIFSFLFESFFARDVTVLTKSDFSKQLGLYGDEWILNAIIERFYEMNDFF